MLGPIEGRPGALEQAAKPATAGPLHARRRTPRVGVRALRAAGPTVVIASFVVLLARSLPMTYDEAHNWLMFATAGIGHITHTYPVPDNQVLFTVLQSFLPASWVWHDPLTLRLVNIVIAIVLVNLMYYWLVQARVPRAVALAGLLLTGPTAVLYFGVARGYLLGTTLAFVGIHILAGRQRRSVVAVASAGVLFALAVYTVPTFAFGMVGIAVVLSWYRRLRDVLVWGVTAVVVAVVLYSPILHQLLSLSRATFEDLPPQAPGAYSLGMLRASLYLTAFGRNVMVLVAAGVVLALAVGFWCAPALFGRSIAAVPARAASRDGPGGPVARHATVFQLVGAYALGYVVVVLLLDVVHRIHAPYYRNSIFVGFALVLLLLRGMRSSSGWWRRVAAAAVVVNLVAGAVGVSLLVTGLDYSSTMYGNILNNIPPRSFREVSRLGATKIICSLNDMPVCDVYAHYLARRGIEVTGVTWTGNRYRCVTGWRRPSYPDGVVLLRGDRDLGMLCER